MFELQGWNGWQGQWETVATSDNKTQACHAYKTLAERRPLRLLQDGATVLGNDNPYAFYN